MRNLSSPDMIGTHGEHPHKKSIQTQQCKIMVSLFFFVSACTEDDDLFVQSDK